MPSDGNRKASTKIVAVLKAKVDSRDNLFQVGFGFLSLLTKYSQLLYPCSQAALINQNLLVLFPFLQCLETYQKIEADGTSVNFSRSYGLLVKKLGLEFRPKSK